MRESKSMFVVGFVGAMLSLGGCNSNPATAQKETKEFTEVCAKDELQSKGVIYFGPSNQIGPGSIWERLGENGGYQPRWRTEDLNIDPAKVVQLGKAFPCDCSKNAKLTADVGISVISLVANVSADLKADFERARTIKVSASETAWDTVVTGPYQVQLKTIADDFKRNDVSGENRLVVRRALRLSGYKALLDFDMNFAPTMKAKYYGMKLGPKTVGEAGAQFNAKWTTDEKLELSAADNVYVAGEFAELKNGEFRSTRGKETIQDLGDKWIKPYARPRQ